MTSDVRKRHPDDAATAAARGVELLDQGRLADATSMLAHAIALSPEHPEARNDLGVAFARQGRIPQALEHFRVAVRLRPGSLPFFDNAYHAVQLLSGEDAALDLLREQLAAAGPAAPLRAAAALELLRHGRLREGFAEMLWNVVMKGLQETPPAAGSLAADLSGRELTLWADQGMGDAIFFLRYVPALLERNARVTLRAPAALVPLLNRWRDAQKIRIRPFGRIDEPPPYLLCSAIPGLLGADRPAPSIRIDPDPAAVERARLRLAAAGPRPFVGLAWRAGPDPAKPRNDAPGFRPMMKSLPLELLTEAFADFRGVIAIVQRAPLAAEVDLIRRCAPDRVVDFSPANENLEEAAAVLAALDDTVTVSSTNVHIAAALGKRARVLVPASAREWRWGRGERSPWFPEFSVYRQPDTGDWSQPGALLRRALLASV